MCPHTKLGMMHDILQFNKSNHKFTLVIARTKWTQPMRMDVLIIILIGITFSIIGLSFEIAQTFHRSDQAITVSPRSNVNNEAAEIPPVYVPIYIRALPINGVGVHAGDRRKSAIGEPSTTIKRAKDFAILSHRGFHYYS